MTKENANLTPDIFEIASQEAQEIKSLIPPKGIPGNQRRVFNDQIRAKLPLVSDLALSGLYKRHHLSFEELRGRLREGRVSQMESLFEIMIQVIHERVDIGIDKMYSLALKNAVGLAPVVTQEVIVNCSAKLIKSCSRDPDLLVNLLVERSDWEEILNKLVSEFPWTAFHSKRIGDMVIEIKNKKINSVPGNSTSGV